MKRFQPFAVSLPITLLTLLALWCATSRIDYSIGDTVLQSLRTAGWFFLGFPINLLLALLVGWLFASLVRKQRTMGVAIASFALGGFVVSSFLALDPGHRVKRIIGPRATSLVTIQRLVSMDSFGDGTFTQGILSANQSAVDAIITHRQLTPTPIVVESEFANLWPKQPTYADRLKNSDQLYAERTGMTDGRSMFYFDKKQATIYFWKRGS